MSIKNVKPTPKSGYKQGYFVPQNPQKYVGNPGEIIFRSSWELRFANYCDLNPQVINWSSEPLEIPFFNPIDERMHKYYVDFYIKVKKDDESFDEFLLEVKPEKQIMKPLLEGKRKTLKKVKAYNKRLETYIVNQAKFKAAKIFAEKKGYKFLVITEKFLFEGWKDQKKPGKNT